MGNSEGQQMEIEIKLKPRVLLVNGLALTTSLAVAEHFDKRHDHVVHGIRKLIADGQGKELLSKHIFEDNYVDDKGRTYPSFRLTEQGFSLVAMRFTGDKAFKWQLAYVEAFTAMKAYITDKAASAAAAETAKYLEQSELLRLQLTLAEKNLQVVTVQNQNLTLQLSMMQAENAKLAKQHQRNSESLHSVNERLAQVLPRVLPEDSKHFPIMERQRIFSLLICDHKAALLDLKKKGFDAVQDNLTSMIGRESLIKLAHCTSPVEAALLWMILRNCGLDGSMLIGNNHLLSLTKPYIRTTETIKLARARLETRGLIHVLRNKYRFNGPTGYKVNRTRLLEVLRGFDQDWKEHIKRISFMPRPLALHVDGQAHPNDSSLNRWFIRATAAKKPLEG